ncbi:hypothetical protein LMG28138_01154 [Pararobbsia alpina]|uniref:Uncharacterized protein n=1 Tax=Pararobbsia alpina TaxID=621374 RepID=A0A6S7B5Y3_9BURK|nr:hypothetical protein LMG28138_01154 [Pararobbsia alpina]
MPSSGNGTILRLYVIHDVTNFWDPNVRSIHAH